MQSCWWSEILTVDIQIVIFTSTLSKNTSLVVFSVTAGARPDRIVRSFFSVTTKTRTVSYLWRKLSGKLWDFEAESTEDILPPLWPRPLPGHCQGKNNTENVPLAEVCQGRSIKEVCVVWNRPLFYEGDDNQFFHDGTSRQTLTCLTCMTWIQGQARPF